MHQNQSNIIPVHSHFQGKFNTSTGRLIDLLDPAPDSLHIDDISKALSRICRFGGHSSAFYSVAQHSLLVAAICAPSCKQWGLMHDSPEAYLGDVIKPLKVLLEPHYRLIEERFEKAIINRYKISVTDEIKAAVKKADTHMLELEHEALILGRPQRLVALLSDYNLDLFGWAWDAKTSEGIFKATYKKLFE